MFEEIGCLSVQIGDSKASNGYRIVRKAANTQILKPTSKS